MQTRRRSILCVDDDPDDQMMVLDTILEIDPSVRVASALNGLEGVSFLQGAKERKELPCLVLLDDRLLTRNRQFLSRLKKDKAFAGMPVVLFTSSPDSSLAALYGVELITKPINPRELFEAVSRLVGSGA